MALIWPGVPLIDCAIIRPLVSNMPQARSWLSRTMVLKAVRMSASCCSLATDRKRFQITSRVTGSMLYFPSLNSTTTLSLSSTRARPRAPTINVDSRSSTIAGPSNCIPGCKRIAIIDRGLDIAVASRESRPGASLCAHRRRLEESRGSFKFISGRGPLATTRQLITSSGTSGPLRP